MQRYPFCFFGVVLPAAKQSVEWEVYVSTSQQVVSGKEHGDAYQHVDVSVQVVCLVDFSQSGKPKRSKDCSLGGVSSRKGEPRLHPSFRAVTPYGVTECYGPGVLIGCKTVKHSENDCYPQYCGHGQPPGWIEQPAKVDQIHHLLGSVCRGDMLQDDSGANREPLQLRFRSPNREKRKSCMLPQEVLRHQLRGSPSDDGFLSPDSARSNLSWSTCSLPVPFRPFLPERAYREIRRRWAA